MESGIGDMKNANRNGRLFFAKLCYMILKFVINAAIHV